MPLLSAPTEGRWRDKAPAAALTAPCRPTALEETTALPAAQILLSRHINWMGFDVTTCNLSLVKGSLVSILVCNIRHTGTRT